MSTQDLCQGAINQEARKAGWAPSSRMSTSRRTEQEFGIHLVASGNPGQVLERRVAWTPVFQGSHFLLKKQMRTNIKSGEVSNSIFRSILPTLGLDGKHAVQ